MKKLLLIICLLPVLAFGQFSGAKKLLLQQGEYCQYGNLANYTNYTLTWISSTFGNCSDVTITDLATAKQLIDNKRNCTIGGGTAFPSWYYTLNIGSYILHALYQPTVCDGSLADQDGWTVLAPNSSSFTPIGSIPIIRLENGVITYIEYY